jgi:hypothetical protein
MINEREIRIGNNLHDFNGKLVQVFSIKINNIRCIYKRIDTNTSHVSLYHNEELHRIPLTPEILEKCGFKKWGRDDMPRTLSYELGSMQIFPSNTFCDFDGYGFLHYKLPNPIDGKDESARFKFKHLHQLQNLYYALTGNELNYQP